MQELREMVIRGPHEHPGAVAVENERGQLLNLGKLSREVRIRLGLLVACVLSPHRWPCTVPIHCWHYG